MSDDDLSAEWLAKLFELREQGMQVTDINPVSALADIIGDQIGSGEVTADRLRGLLDHPGGSPRCGRRPALMPAGRPRFPIWAVATSRNRPTAPSLPRIRSLPCGWMFRPRCAPMPIPDQARHLTKPSPRVSR